MKKKLLNKGILKKTMARMTLIALISLFSIHGAKAQTITVGNNTGTTLYYPLYNYYGYSYSQSIYLAGEISAAGGSGPAYISSIKYYYAATGSDPLNWEQWNISMGNTSLSTFADGNSWVSTTSLTPVFSGSINIPANPGQWMTIQLSTPFLWDGTSNIVIAVDENSPGYADPYSSWQSTTVGAPTDYRSLLYFDDSNNPNPASPPTANQYDNIFPDIQFVTYPATMCSGAPASATAIATASTLCSGNPVDLDLDNYGLTAGYSYQWQSSPNGSTWTNMGSAQFNTAYSIGSLTATTHYQCVITCTASAQSTTSTPVVVNLTPPINCYCMPSLPNNFSSDCSLDYITGFSVANVSSQGATCDSYGFSDSTASNYTTVNLNAGNTYTLTVNTTISGNTGNGALGAWIDYDQNRIFDANEYINVGYGLSGSYSSPFTVPLGTPGGAVRIRLKLDVWYGSASSVIDPCSNNGNDGDIGQIIDYKVNMTPAAPCAGNPTAGDAVVTNSSVCASDLFTLDLVNYSIATGLSYQWQSSPNGTAWTNIGTASSVIPNTVTGQIATTYYRCVVTCTNSALSGTSTPVTVNQNNFMACYCAPSFFNCGNGDQFSSVVFESINDVPTCNFGGGYSNQSAAGTATLNAGQSYPINTTIGVAAYSSDFVGAWIDYDHSGTFDPIEFTLIGSGSNTVISGNIAIPFTALGGVTAMRLMVNSYGSTTYYTPLLPCSPSGSSYGEVLDYSILIMPSPGCTGAPTTGTAVATATAVCPGVSFGLDLAGEGMVSDISYQWQSSTNGTTWTNLGPAQVTVPYSISSQSVTAQYRCVLTCTSSAQSATSTPVTVNENPPTACYCTPSGFYCSNEAIGNFVFETINDNPACGANSYIDNTTAMPTPTISANQTYTTMLAVATNSPGLYAIAGVWLDYNADGTFDQNEYTSLGTGITVPTPVTASVSIPFTAVGGITRMRVIVDASFNSFTGQDPCNSSGSAGMAIDYQVYIIPAPACSGAPSAGTTIANVASTCPDMPINLDLSGNSIATGISYQWQSSLNGSSWGNLDVAQMTVPYQVTTQTVTTYYRCVLTCTSSAMTATSTPVMINQNAPTACYCVNPPTDCTDGDVITTVALTTMTNTSLCDGTNGYSDYTSTVASATVAAGVTYTLTTTAGYEYNENVSAWIDYDQNGVFDPSEYTYIGYSNGNDDTIRSTISIPVNALVGTTRMRVRIYSSGQLMDVDACNNPASSSPPLMMQNTLVVQNNAYGETEDYLVTITPPNCSLINYPPNISATASSASVCSTSSVGLDLGMQLQPATGLTYQWQTSSDGTNFTDIGTPAGTSSVSLTSPQTGYYQCEILCNGSPAATSGTVFVTVVSPTIIATATPTNVCQGDTAILMASGGVNYTWSNTASTATVAVGPSVTTTYSVTGADINGCTSTTAVTLNVTPSTSISGSVTTAPGAVAVAGQVILYQYKPFLVKFDSVATTNIQADGSYLFPSVNSATFIVKAVPSASSLQITYAPSVISWQSAAPFTHGCVVTSITDIQVQTYTVLTTGTGSLSGRIYGGPGFHKSPGMKPEAPGNPIPGVVVKGGKNPGAAIFGQTVTDATGNYAFNNLPVNTGDDFFILVDIPGLDTNTTYHKLLTTSVNSYDSLNFIVDGQYVTPIQDVTTSINTLNIADNEIKVFPNPANTYFTVSYSLLKQSNVKIELLDVVGKNIKHIQPVLSQAPGDYAQSVPVGTLSEGMYFIRIYIDGTEATVKLCVTN